MLTTSRLRKHLQRLSYKPGFVFEVYDGRHEGQHLVIRATVENSYRPGETVELDIHSPLPPMPSVDYFEAWLLWRLQRIEVHEAMEWFKRDRAPVCDPHRVGADQDR